MTDRDDIIEELYSLEQSWRGGLPSRSVNWSAADEATNACADELADLIKELTEDAHLVQNDGRGAELGQEVGAVESVWMFRCAGSRDEWMPFVNEKHRLNTMRSPEWEVREFTSPAHTSDARDVVSVDVREMKTSAGRDYYVCVQVGDRYLTPNMYREKWKADFDAAEWTALFNGTARPDILSFMPEDAAMRQEGGNG